MRDTFTVPKSGLMAFKIVRCPFRSPVCEGPPTASSRSGRGPAGANLELGTQTQRLSSDLSIVISISWLSGYLGHKSHNTQQTNNSHKVIFSQAGHVPPLLDSFEIEL